MQRLIAFLLKKHHLFIFLLLESLAIGLLLHNNSYHRSVTINAVNDFSGAVYEKWSNVTRYFNLTEVNRSLAKENALLRENNMSAFMAIDKNIFTWHDTLYKQHFQYVVAKVVHATVNNKRNIIIVNKGENQGIEPDMGVISSDGVTGIVMKTSANYALILPVVNIGSNIAAKLKNNEQRGVVIWNGKRYQTGTLQGIPAHVKCSIGDTIITSGNSMIFPEGIPVGTVESYTIDKRNFFYNINIRFFVDFNALSYVYIIRNHLKEEPLALMKNYQDESRTN
ncbi:MAG: rod shape-determining protein MreC [Bacteroidales bacterium]|nr:rod shape-determining protein MreC [Bacteroidales bacterium]